MTDPGPDAAQAPPRRVRADARRNIDAVLEAAKAVFAAHGVDAPVREIAAKAGVGVGTLYRHFPQRADLVAAVFRHEVDACADAAPVFAAEHDPDEALSLWLQRFTGFIATKRGLASALHSGDPTFDSLPQYFESRFLPALDALLDAAAAAGAIRADVDARELLNAISGLSMSEDPERPGQSARMVALLVDGLRHRAR
ncbi:TetR/AcrR family transcriptional regulator [Pseudonocardia endophytica]|uniref:TetR family transcriptional regulator n=1 Tax=Pseudonocardia endophytica TaxID=401976 RepID=A0A4R1HPN1_PSEEN|nr:TetR/AcrR family transcriptional regulator [Pseudonocardia endophytica]TCK24517.1 TetR family transcriptional regulator [Pseudonocardia endophytica]